MVTKKIKLQVGDNELEFKVDTVAHNKYIDEVKMDAKVTPSVNFLRRTLADQKQQPILNELCDAGLAVEIATKLIEEFKPQVEIFVKK